MTYPKGRRGNKIKRERKMAVEENEACGEMGESGMGLKGHRTGVAQGEHRPRKDYKEPRPLPHESTLQAVYLITQPEHGKLRNHKHLFN